MGPSGRDPGTPGWIRRAPRPRAAGSRAVATAALGCREGGDRESLASSSSGRVWGWTRPTPRCAARGLARSRGRAGKEGRTGARPPSRLAVGLVPPGKAWHRHRRASPAATRSLSTRSLSTRSLDLAEGFAQRGKSIPWVMRKLNLEETDLCLLAPLCRPAQPDRVRAVVACFSPANSRAAFPGGGAVGVGGGFRGAGPKPGSRALGPAASALNVPYRTGKKPNPSSCFLRAGPCGRPPGLSRDVWRQPCPHLPFESGSEVVCGQSQLQTQGGRGGGLWAKGPPSAEVRTAKLRSKGSLLPLLEASTSPSSLPTGQNSSSAPDPTPAGVGRPGRAGASTPLLTVESSFIPLGRSASP